MPRLLRLAVQPDVRRLRRDSFADRWVEQLARRGRDAKIVGVFAPDIVDRLRECDGFLSVLSGPPGSQPGAFSRVTPG